MAGAAAAAAHPPTDIDDGDVSDEEDDDFDDVDDIKYIVKSHDLSIIYVWINGWGRQEGIKRI